MPEHNRTTLTWRSIRLLGIRNNIILVNLLHALPAGELATRAMEGRPSIAQALFTHIHYGRHVIVFEDPSARERCPRKNGRSSLTLVASPRC